MEIVLISTRHLRRLTLLAALAAAPAAPLCAQNKPQSVPAVQAGVPLSPHMERRIEVMIRNRSGITPDYTVQIGIPTPGEVPGYDQVMVTFVAPGEDPSKAKTLPFYVSTDGNTLAQFNKFDMRGDLRNALSDAGRPARGGDEKAPVLLVVFDDLECPFCARMNNEMMPAVRSRYKDEVRIVYRDFPLDQHPWAMHAAVDANCLASETSAGYWDYVDYVHAHSAEIGADAKSLPDSEKQLDKLALDEGTHQGVNQPELVACVLKQDSSKIQASVNTALADPIHIDQAPVIFINGEKIEGVVSVDTLYRVIDRALIAEGRTPPPPPVATPQSGHPASGAAQPAQAKPGS